MITQLVSSCEKRSEEEEMKRKALSYIHNPKGMKVLLLSLHTYIYRSTPVSRPFVMYKSISNVKKNMYPLYEKA